MLILQSDIEGKMAYYGDIRKPFDQKGFHICGGWEYHEAKFDNVLYEHGGTTIYLRLPVTVIESKLDRDDALLRFERPFLIKHIVHTGLVEDSFTALGFVGLNQFQKPLDPDDHIENETRWRQAGEEAINRIKPYVHA